MAAPWVGLQQTAEHSVAGSVFAAFDQVTGGRIGANGGDVSYEVGAGGQATKHRGMIEPAWSYEGILQSIGILGNVKPAAVGSLPPIIQKIQGGPLADTNAAKLIEDCYITSTKISCSENGKITISHSGLGLTIAPTTIASAATKIANKPFPWHNMDIDFNGSSFKCIGWDVEWTCAVSLATSLDLKTAGVQRMPEWAEPGDFQGKLSARFRVPLTQTNDFYDDYPDVATFKVVALNNDTVAKTFTLDMTAGSGIDMSDNSPMPITKSKDQVIFEVTGQTMPNDLAICVMTLA